MTEKERLELLGLGSTIKSAWTDGYQKLIDELSQSPAQTATQALQKEIEKYRQMAAEYETWYEKYTHIGISQQLDEAISNMQKLAIPKDSISQYLDNALAINSLLPKNTHITSKTADVPKSSSKEKQTPKTKAIKIKSIKLNNFRFFTDDEQNNTFEVDGENVLIYGENGSGKSSLFKAFEFLAKKKVEANEFEENINKFSNGTDTFLEFVFDKVGGDSVNDSVVIDNEHLDASGEYGYVKNISIFKPMLNYQKLLQVSYSEHGSGEEKNLYSFFEQILEEYPIEEDKTLKDIRGEGEAYFAKYKQIIKDELLDEINILLEKFKHDFKITDIKFDSFNKTVFLKIDFFEQDVGKYHLFLNEARLSALAMSVYFAIIKKQFALLESDSLKILILDDLLISLDMNNRMNLVDILKSEFSDYQIFFFTHDRGLFEVFKDKMSWRAFEIYVDRHQDGYEIPLLKASNSELEQARLHKLKRNYQCSANLLRQYTEKLLCKYLPPEKLVNKNCKELDLNGLLQNAIAFESAKADKNQDIIDNLSKLQTYRRVMLNQASHASDANIFLRELEDAIAVLGVLEAQIYLE